MGGMGEQTRPEYVPKPKLEIVKIIKTLSGFSGICNGGFISLKLFDKKKLDGFEKGIFGQGVLGYWKRIEDPEIPEDIEGLFVANKDRYKS